MTKVGEKSKIEVHWNVSPYDYSPDKLNIIASKMAKKYSVPKDRVKVVPEFEIMDESGKNIQLTSDVVSNIQDPEFQVKLFKDFISAEKIENCDFDEILKIDKEINSRIDYKVYDNYKRYSINYIKWSNFLSYGDDNFFDFRTQKGVSLLNGEPANQSGKTTFAIDLLHFLLFGKTTKVPTQNLIFNKHLPEATTVDVEGSLTIEGSEYIIKRTLSRPALAKRTAKSKVTQKVEYYRVIGDTKESLGEYDDLQAENSVQTNKVIKEAIGKEEDFDLIISVTEDNLNSLIEKKEMERGRLLSRWIGLLPIEEKDAIAREKFNSDVKPYLTSNLYRTDALQEEIKSYELVNEENKKAIETYKANADAAREELVLLEGTKNALMSSKQQIDDALLHLDSTTLKSEIDRITNEGIQRKGELDNVINSLNAIGNVDFSVDEYDRLVDMVSKARANKGIIGEQYRETKNKIQNLKNSEYCPTCGRKLDNVDNTKQIESFTQRLNEITKEGEACAKTISEYEKAVEDMKVVREKFNTSNQMTMKKSALELSLAQMRNTLVEKKALLENYKKNSDAIDKNNELEIKIRNTGVLIDNKKKQVDVNTENAIKMNGSIEHNVEEIKKRKELIEKIKEEEKVVKNWKIYLKMIGKDGITKMILRKTLPIVNARLEQLLFDICDFSVEISVNEKNDVTFSMIKDGVRSDLSSGSGFERTAASLALRIVLGDISTMPKPNIVVLDECFGCVSKEMLPNMHKLLLKICDSYQAALVVSHLDTIKDWADCVISIKKENNISKILSSK